VSAWGGTLVEPWVPMGQYKTTAKLKGYYDETLAKVIKGQESYSLEKAKIAHEKQMKKWQSEKKKAKDDGVPFKKRKPRMRKEPMVSNRIPSTLYNGMIAPLVPYAIKGAIWYQGESNAKYQTENYQEHFTALIEGWRNVWGQKRLDFYWCQLAQYKDTPKEPVDEDGWVDVCYQQKLTMSLPNTGMAVLNDIGEAKDIHPHNKMDAGKRLSNWALFQTYGFEELTPSGPIYKSHVIANGKVTITFDHVGSGLMAGKKVLLDPALETKEPLKFFQIKGADGAWKWADAEIVSKDQVVVSHAKISEPVEVRYAWASNAKGANLYKKEGLPASLFKTIQ
jgi:sialate O-acetylesterase